MVDDYFDPHVVQLGANPPKTSPIKDISPQTVANGVLQNAIHNETTIVLQNAILPTTIEKTQPEWPGIEDARKRAFLQVYQETGNISAGCRMAKIDRTTHYRWAECDPDYANAVESCAQGAVDRLESEAYRRAVEGVSEPTGWYKGLPGGMVQRYSDTLAIFLLKGLRPEKYADRIELKGALANLDLTKLPDWMLEQIAAGRHPLEVLASAAAENPLLGSGETSDTNEVTDDSE